MLTAPASSEFRGGEITIEKTKDFFY